MKVNYLFYLTFILTVVILSTSFAQTNTQLGLPEGAIARLGKGGINIMRFSPDGTRLAVGTDVGVWLYDVPDGKETALFIGHTGRVNALAFSKDGKMLASGGAGNPIIQVWDMETKSKLKALKLTHDPVSVYELEFNGKTLISINRSREVYFWHVDTSIIVLELNLVPSYDKFVFSQDGSNLAAGDRQGRIHLWDTTMSKKLATLTGHRDSKESEILALAFSHDNRLLASGGEDKKVMLWDTQNNIELGTLNKHGGWVTAIAFSEDGKTLASGGAGKVIILWDVEKRQERATITAHKNTINALTFAPVGTPLYGMCLASGSADGTIRFWNPITGKELATFTTGHTEWVKAVAFSENDTTLTTVAFNGIVDEWSLKMQQELNTFTDGQSDLVDVATLSSDGSILALQGKRGLIAFKPYSFGMHATFSGTNHISLWRMSLLGEEISKQWENPNSVFGDAAIFSPSHNMIAVSGNRSIRGYHVNTGVELFYLEIEGQSLRSKPMFSPNGKWLATSDPFGSRQVRVWNVESPNEPVITSLKKISALAFSPDSSTLAMLSDNGIYLWKFGIASKDEPTLIIEKSLGYQNVLTFSPDGTILIVSSVGYQNNPIELWEVQTGKSLRILSGHTEPVETLVFSHDGKILASGSQDGTVLLWDWNKIIAKRKAEIK